MRFLKFKIFTTRIFKSQRGVALLMAIFCVMVMAFLATEITYDTTVEYVISSKEYGRIKAYEAARSGVELSLLRIQLYKNLLNTLGEQLKGQEAYTQMVWSFPFVWPPTIPENASMASKDQIGSSVSESFMEAKYQTSISSEGSKIDINDLDSPSESLRKSIKDQLIQIFKTKIENDDEWREKYQDNDYLELIDNIQDWIDEDRVSLRGGDESSKYEKQNPDDEIPPNRPFQTLDEIRNVAGMNEELFQFILPQITIYGVKGINVNQASGELLKSIDPILTDETITEVLERRSNPEKGGPFRDDEDFIGFIGANAQNFNPSGIPLYYGNEYNFRIRSVGTYNNIQREIIAIVYDVDGVKDRLKTILDKEEQDKNPNPQQGQNPQQPPQQGQQAGQPANPQQQQQQQNQLSTSKPRIVYWYEN